MITSEQLKFCEICKHRKLDLQKGMLCRLTQEYPTFESYCPTFEQDLGATKQTVTKTKEAKSFEAPLISWRTLLTVVVALIALVRLGFAIEKYIKSNEREENLDSQLQELIDKSNERAKYKDQIEELDPVSRAELGLIKTQQDTFIKISEKMKLWLPRNHYIFSNVANENIVFLGRNSLNSNLLIYKIKQQKNETADYAWYVMRKPFANEVMKTDLSVTKTGNNDFFYVLKNELQTINGYAWVKEEDGYWYVCQLENGYNDKYEIQNYATQFYRYNIKKIQP